MVTRFLAFMCVLFVVSTAHAECYTIEAAPLDAECVVMRYGEQRGVWVRDELAGRLLVMQTELAEQQQLVAQYQKLMSTRSAQVVLLRAAAREYQEAIGTFEDANTGLSEANDRLRKRVRASRVWWKHPAVWFVAGVVVTGGTITVITVGR